MRVNVAREFFLPAKRRVSSVPAAPRVCGVSEEVFFFFSEFVFEKGSTGVLPFGKPE